MIGPPPRKNIFSYCLTFAFVGSHTYSSKKRASNCINNNYMPTMASKNRQMSGNSYTVEYSPANYATFIKMTAN